MAVNTDLDVQQDWEDRALQGGLVLQVHHEGLGLRKIVQCPQDLLVSQFQEDPLVQVSLKRREWRKKDKREGKFGSVGGGGEGFNSFILIHRETSYHLVLVVL